MNEVNLIVAIGKDGSIGSGGDLVWHIRDDLKRFKALTTGHPVIMGRKTWESLPKRPLPGRRNIVVTTNKEYSAPGAETVAGPHEALKATEGESPFIIGGGKIYETLLPFTTHLYLTKIDAEAPYADTWLQINEEEWMKTDEEGPYSTDDGISYRFVTYKRK